LLFYDNYFHQIDFRENFNKSSKNVFCINSVFKKKSSKNNNLKLYHNETLDYFKDYNYTYGR